ncbi:isopentenyl-diphosphate Delta-isomerase [Nonomuraea sp. SBT364]|uniref:isopentenyl-diphosphate Delta-isomerase n=1 Tax=Nonomuraea sp. SBT364 TaxID=1580530 RepID=UPI0018CFBBD9|nr:isopentenyl-diphosphate Delta-isomerase [Nonomuraea sp. SBT364]
MTTVEHVVLVDGSGHALGTAPKLSVHSEHTPLHLAFSSYVFDRSGRVMLTRRASHKLTWPGVWTNSCCGHPMPGEPLDHAVIRRLSYELGLKVERADLVLPRFSYRAVMDNGVVEHELCPVYRVMADNAESPNPDEVDETRWMPWQVFADGVLNGLLAISPWCREQVPLLAALGPDPLAWPAAPDAELPPAARVRLD